MSHLGTGHVPFGATLASVRTKEFSDPNPLRIAIEKPQNVPRPVSIDGISHGIAIGIGNFVAPVSDPPGRERPKRVRIGFRRDGVRRLRSTQVEFLAEFDDLHQFLSAGASLPLPTDLLPNAPVESARFKFLLVFHCISRCSAVSVVMVVRVGNFLRPRRNQGTMLILVPSGAFRVLRR
jgi:hypothetical protein